MRTSVLRRVTIGLAAPAVLALGLAACGSGDVSKEKFTSDLQDEAGYTEAQATCVTDRLYDELEQDQINDLYEADTEEEAGAEGFEALTTAATDCATAE
jgi:hypothetical protein